MTATRAVWHDLENGSYDADLPLWRELADEASGGAVLDLGAGTGRVAADLAARGHELTALDSDPELLAVLAARVSGVTTVEADVRDFDLGRRFALVIAPMQLVQIVGGAAGRAALMERAHAHLEPGGRFAAALADPREALGPARWRGGPRRSASLACGAALGAGAPGWSPPLPDIVERDGWVFSSQPLAVRERDGQVLVERRRQAVSPAGELEASEVQIALDVVDVGGFESEARAAGLEPIARRAVPETPDHIGSMVVICRR